VLDRYLVWRVRKQVLVFILDQLTPLDAKIFKHLPPSSDLENIILVTASLSLTQQKKSDILYFFRKMRKHHKAYHLSKLCAYQKKAL
jgi:hypothetical protein